jgi:ABC-2 type transport system ATP-binding protein
MHPPAVRVENAVKAFATQSQRPLTRLSVNAAAGGARAPQAAIVALAGVSFDVRPGEIFGLLGPNGSGKTTLLRLIGSQLAPDSGQVAVFGRDTTADPREARVAVGRFGSAAPSADFFLKLSPVENLLYGAKQYALRPAETRRQVLNLLARLGLPASAHYRPMAGLSRGTQQMVAIARSFLAEPRLLLLDEPTASLDPRARRAVHTFIRDLRARHGATVLLATHDLEEAEALCDRVAVVDAGRLVALDTPAALKRRSGTLEDAFLSLTHNSASPPREEMPA